LRSRSRFSSGHLRCARSHLSL